MRNVAQPVQFITIAARLVNNQTYPTFWALRITKKNFVKGSRHPSLSTSDKQCKYIPPKINRPSHRAPGGAKKRLKKDAEAHCWIVLNQLLKSQFLGPEIQKSRTQH